MRSRETEKRGAGAEAAIGDCGGGEGAQSAVEAEHSSEFAVGSEGESEERFDRIDDDVELDDFGIVSKEYVPVLEQNIQDDESDMDEELSDYVFSSQIFYFTGRREELLHV